RVITVVNHPYQEEQRSRGQTVVEHLQKASRQACCIQCEHPEHAEPKVADTAIGNELLDIALRQGTKSPINDADDCKRADQGYANQNAGVGRKGQTHAEKTISPDLEQYPGQNHASCCRSFYMCKRQPGM